MIVLCLFDRQLGEDPSYAFAYNNLAVLLKAKAWALDGFFVVSSERKLKLVTGTSVEG